MSAPLGALKQGYTVDGASRSPGVSVGVEYLSGDDDPTDGTYKVFDTLYATNHKFYGFMDYFLNIPVHTFGLGLRDVHARSPSSRTATLAFVWPIIPFPPTKTLRLQAARPAQVLATK